MVKPYRSRDDSSPHLSKTSMSNIASVLPVRLGSNDVAVFYNDRIRYMPSEFVRLFSGQATEDI